MNNPFADLTANFISEPGHTFDEWNRKGYRVLRGEKATGRNGDGVPTFTSDQVVHADDEKDHYAIEDGGPLNRF